MAVAAALFLVAVVFYRIGYSNGYDNGWFDARNGGRRGA